jgi:hypothetical protein
MEGSRKELAALVLRRLLSTKSHTHKLFCTQKRKNPGGSAGGCGACRLLAVELTQISRWSRRRESPPPKSLRSKLFSELYVKSRPRWEPRRAPIISRFCCPLTCCFAVLVILASEAKTPPPNSMTSQLDDECHSMPEMPSTSTPTATSGGLATTLTCCSMRLARAYPVGLKARWVTIFPFC